MAKLIGTPAVPRAHGRRRAPRLRRQGRLRARQSGARARARRPGAADRGISRSRLGAADAAARSAQRARPRSASQRGAHLAKFDRPRRRPARRAWHCRARNSLTDAGAGDPPRDARDQHLEVERLGDDVVGAGREGRRPRRRLSTSPGDQDHRQCRVSTVSSRISRVSSTPLIRRHVAARPAPGRPAAR